MVFLYSALAILAMLIMYALTQSLIMAALGGFMGGMIGALIVVVYHGYKTR